MRELAIFVSGALAAAALAGCGNPRPAAERSPAAPMGSRAAARGFATVSVQTLAGETVTAVLPRRSFSFAASGQTYYVSNSGSDENDGSIDAPWATVNRATAAVAAGDVVYLRGGTYPPFSISTSGTAARPIVLSSYPGEEARIVQPPGWQAAHPNAATVTLAGCTYVWIHGLYIEGCLGQPDAPPRDEYGQNGITLRSGAGLGVKILNNTVTRAQHCGIKEMNHGGSQYLVEGNVAYENGINTSTDHGIYIPSQQATVRGNACFRNAAFGIHLCGNPSGCYVYDNVCFENRGSGIIVCGPNNVIAHNVCARNSEYGLFLFRSGCKNNTFLNNILMNNVQRQIDMDSAGSKKPSSYPSKNTIDHTCIWPVANWATDLVAGWCGSHLLFADPLVVDAAGNDYELLPGSPCRGIATKVTLKGAYAARDIGLFPATLFTD